MFVKRYFADRAGICILFSRHSWSLASKRSAGSTRESRAVAMARDRNESPEERAARKALVKEEKAARRARKEGNVPEEYGQKNCELCSKLKDLLIRCQINEQDRELERWHMVCGKCWNEVSGGVVDGDDSHPYYRYGGLWKNRHKEDAR